VKKRLAIGSAWAALAATLAAWHAINLLALAVDVEHGLRTRFFEPTWWWYQLGMLLFIVMCAAVGVGIALGRRWGLTGLRVAGPIALTYLAAYNILGGERAWWISVGTLLLTAFVAATVYMAFKRASEFATGQ
jgi:hypothetical protein